jgi:hypothetical protein
MWASGHNGEIRRAAHGYEAMREAAMAGPESAMPITAKLPMSERHVSRIGRLTAFCLLVAAVVTIGLAIAGALKRAGSPVPQLASQK